MESENVEGHVLIWLANVLCIPTCTELPLPSIKDLIPISFFRLMGGRGTYFVCNAGIENEIFATFHL